LCREQLSLHCGAVCLAGVGWAMFSVSFIVSIYYNMLVAYCVFYVFASFAKDVPWRDCGNPWNTAGRWSVTMTSRVANGICNTSTARPS